MYNNNEGRKLNMRRRNICCICGCEIEGIGNNPDGAMWRDPDTNELVEFEPEENDRCCDNCNSRYVIPGRLYKLSRGKQ